MQYIGPTGATDFRWQSILLQKSDVDCLMLDAHAQCATFFMPLIKGVGVGEQDVPRLPKGFGDSGRSRSVAGRPVVSGDFIQNGRNKARYISRSSTNKSNTNEAGPQITYQFNPVV